MAITQQMVVLRIEDIGALAEARSLLRLVRELKEAARRAETRDLLAELQITATAIAACVAEALRAGAPREELRRLREAGLAVSEARVQLWEAFGAGVLSTVRFDELMAGTARCRREITTLEASVRRRARRDLDVDS